MYHGIILIPVWRYHQIFGLLIFLLMWYVG